MDGVEPRILLVDDDELSRRMMGLLLSEKGYNYGTASNGLEAVEAVKSQKYDFVLMDLQMPLMDGFDATRKIREWEAGEKHIPIVALTAMLFDNEIQECLSVGMDECVAKPFDTDTLFRLVDSYVYKITPPALKSDFQEVDDKVDLEVLGVQKALPRFSNDIQVYLDFLSEFITDLPDRIIQFQRLFLDGDYEILADRAHSLTGISASMGANQLSYLLQLLDQYCQGGNSALVEHTLHEVEKQIKLVENEANRVLSDKTSKRDN